MLKLTVLCFISLSLILINADDSDLDSNSDICGKLRHQIFGKIQGLKADGAQVTCAWDKISEIVRETIKGTELEEKCGADCKKLMDMMKEDGDADKITFSEVKDQLTMKEWHEKMRTNGEKRSQDSGRMQLYQEEGKKCESCSMENMQSVHKKCGEMSADEFIDTLKTTCGLQDV